MGGGWEVRVGGGWEVRVAGEGGLLSRRYGIMSISVARSFV